MKSCVTVSLVEEARGGPFVYWHDLPTACREAQQLGFDAIELFPPSPDAVDPVELKKLLDDHGLKLAAVGTGAGWVIRKLHLVHADRSIREAASDYIRAIIDFAGQFEAPAIIGSMQGRWTEEVSREQALKFLGDALLDLGERARAYHAPLIYEPLNRYETNLINRVHQGIEFLDGLGGHNVKLLCDLFHMGIEETNISNALREAGELVGHVHFVDSNRRPVGFGHMSFEEIIAALREINYRGYLSAEALPFPDSTSAAQATIDTFRRFVTQESS